MHARTHARLGVLVLVALGVIGAVAAIIAVGYDVLGADGRMGAGFLPFVVGIVVAGAAAVETWRVIGRRGGPPATARELVAEDVMPVDATGAAASTPVTVPQAEAKPAPPDDGADDGRDIFGRTPRQRLRMLAVVIVMLVVALVLVQFVGFLAAFGALLVAISFLVERRKLIPTLLISASALAGTYALLVLLLRVPQPLGLFGS
jgi:putative tricarboxylic transport membrane protein